jgi:hypothetical protein
MGISKNVTQEQLDARQSRIGTFGKLSTPVEETLYNPENHLPLVGKPANSMSEFISGNIINRLAAKSEIINGAMRDFGDALASSLKSASVFSWKPTDASRPKKGEVTTTQPENGHKFYTNVWIVRGIGKRAIRVVIAIGFHMDHREVSDEQLAIKAARVASKRGWKTIYIEPDGGAGEYAYVSNPAMKREIYLNEMNWERLNRKNKVSKNYLPRWEGIHLCWVGYTDDCPCGDD